MGKNIGSIYKTIKYKKEHKNKLMYPYFGMELFLGKFGSGKTLTAVKVIKERVERYPNVTVISNVEIKGIKNIKYFKNSEELTELLMQIDINNIEGYIIFIDEIQVVLAEIFGRTDPIFLTFLSQQRKLAINIIGTTQLFSKQPKFIREYLQQGGQVVICHKLLGILQINKIVEMEETKEDSKNNLIYKRAKIDWFIHTPEMYESYDTFAVISQIQGLMKGSLEYGNRLSNNN